LHALRVVTSRFVLNRELVTEKTKKELVVKGSLKKEKFRLAKFSSAGRDYIVQIINTNANFNCHYLIVPQE
jgi:hypothetical protein